MEFTYDYRGRRVRKVEYYPVGSPHCCVIEDTRFVYDGWNVILELDGEDGNAVQRKYAWGLDLSGTPQGAGGIGGLLALEDTAGTVSTNDDEHYLYFYDGNGNVGQLVDWEDSPGTLAAHYEYDPYSNLITANGPYWQSNLFRFSTKYFDEETGFYSYTFRYYRPDLGRWLNRDPYKELGAVVLRGLHPTNNGLFLDTRSCEGCIPMSQEIRYLYPFVHNNPIGYIDPVGLINWDEIKYCAKGLLGGSIIGLVVGGPERLCCCLRAAKISNKFGDSIGIQGKAVNRYGTTDDHSVINAIYHCVWQCKIANTICGQKGAKQIGDAHEKGDKKNTPDERRMDLHNNSIGRRISKSGARSWGDCFRGCEKAALDGRLWWFTNVDDKPWNARAKSIIKKTKVQNPATGWNTPLLPKFNPK